MSDPFDDWLTSNPHERDSCEEHDHYKPCPFCRVQTAERLYDRQREERHERDPSTGTTEQ
jgi:hypothetical protein